MAALRIASLVVLFALVAPTARSEIADREPLGASRAPSPGESLGPSPILPDPLFPRRSPYFEVGVGVEQFGSDIGGSDTLLGVTAQLRTRDVGGHLLFEAKPEAAGIEDTRFLLGLGGRVHFSVLGARLSYGAGVHGEIRLEDHYWLFTGTPAELGAVVLSHGSWEIELFAGVRHPMAGSLIQHFLIDPNGFDNEDARDRLYDRKHTWVGFARLVFSRRID